jgi:putative ABC transport system permease protein
MESENPLSMIRNYLIIAWRNLMRNRGISAINIGGLALGIASSIILLSYVFFQRSYDEANTAKRDIFRINLDVYQSDRLAVHSAENYSAAGPALQKDFPEIIGQARLYNLGYKNNCVFSHGNTFFKESKWMYADASFLDMFTIPFLQGDVHTALTQPNAAIISVSTAQKIFGGDGIRQAIGKTIQMTDDDRNSELYTITGVFADIPDNAHLKFNILVSYATLDHRRGGGYARFETNWDRKDFYTYIRLRPGVDPASLSARLPAFIRSHIPDEASRRQESRLFLQPLGSIHFGPGLQDEPEPTVNGKAIGFLTLIAFFIIVIAWVNYINLATANSVYRAREIGIRKVLGSTRAKLIQQFLAESIGLNALSAVIAAVVIYVSRPLLHSFFSIRLPLTFLFTSGYGWLFLGFLLLGTVLSGLYPALVLSGFKPALVLKGRLISSAKGLFLRRGLVVFQFTLSILLIVGTIVVYQQVHFMLRQDLGIKVDQVMVLDRPGRWDTARSTHNMLVRRFREAVQREPGVAAVAMSDEKPGKEIRWPSTFSTVNRQHLVTLPINTTLIDENYLPGMGFTLLAGRNFSTLYKADDRAVVLSATAAGALGFAHPADAVGKPVRIDDSIYSIIGVVNDFHQLSLQKQATPAAFQFDGDLREFEYYFIRLGSDGGIDHTIDRVRAAWTNSFHDNPFEYTFLDESFNGQYKSELRFGLIFGVFSLLAICIACIGLLGLVAFTIRQRTKEIGVRKILGADAQDILLLLARDFIRLIALANAIAWPIGWLMMNSWLKDFAYRIHIHWLVFVLSGLIALSIAVAAICLQTIKAASANPIKSLRIE